MPIGADYLVRYQLDNYHIFYGQKMLEIDYNNANIISALYIREYSS